MFPRPLVNTRFDSRVSKKVVRLAVMLTALVLTSTAINTLIIIAASPQVVPGLG